MCQVTGKAASVAVVTVQLMSSVSGGGGGGVSVRARRTVRKRTRLPAIMQLPLR